jgi:hypothetical protein
VLRVKRFAGALVVLGVLGAAGLAQGAVVQEFNFQLKDINLDGRFTVVFSSRSYDPNGGIPDTLTSNTIRLPKGSVVRRQFVNKRYYCDLEQLVSKLKTSKPANVSFGDFLNRKLRGKRVPPGRTQDLIGRCRFARVGSGSVIVDARPLLEPQIPAKLEMFWAKPPSGAIGRFAILSIPDESAAVVRDTPAIRDTYPIVNVDFLDDPTPDGLYEMKIVLPTGPVNGLNISVAEVNVTIPGMTITKKKTACLAKRNGKCVRKKVKRTNLFLFTRPPCPESGQLSFQAFYAYANSPSQTRTISLPCPKFRS